MLATVTDPTRTAHVILNLAAAGRNLRHLKSLAPGAKMMAVIKANAYGHGMSRIARQLGEADAFAVARTDEGLRLRHSGIQQRIAVLQGFVNAEELMAHAAAGLEPVIHSGWQVDLLEMIRLTQPIRIWVKVDTGMHRLGVLPSEFDSVYGRLDQLQQVIHPIPLMSHFASADDLEDRLTQRQLGLFHEAIGHLDGERSLANSAGLFGWGDAHTEWVRPGISLYGVSPFSGRTGCDEGLEPVMTFRTRIISVKDVPAGTRVGYGGDWVCPHDTRLAVAAVGYGDGYPRLARSGTPVLIDGQRVPLVGRVSMDMITLDLTTVSHVRAGDLVTLWGEGLPVEEVASQAGTIAYDLLCGITQRVHVIET